MIPINAQATLQSLAKGYPFIALTGPRQSGKTTLSQQAFPEKPYVSLEDPDTLEFALSDPRRFWPGIPMELSLTKRNAPQPCFPTSKPLPIATGAWFVHPSQVHSSLGFWRELPNPSPDVSAWFSFYL